MIVISAADDSSTGYYCPNCWNILAVAHRTGIIDNGFSKRNNNVMNAIKTIMLKGPE